MSYLSALVATLPKCATTCLLTAAYDSTCTLSNSTCICHNDDLNAQATACLISSCTVRQALFTNNLTNTACGISPHVDHSYIAPFVAFLVLSAVAVGLRVISRIQAKLAAWWDDFIVTLSFLGCIVFTAIVWALRSHGLGTEIWAVPFYDITLNLKALYILLLLYITSRHLARLSILLFYHRMFGRDPLARRLIRWTFGVIVTCCIAFDLAIMFGCTPISYFWTSWDGEYEGRCISTGGILWGGAFVAIAIDIWVMLMPLPFMIKLKFSLRQKMLAGVMFAFGVFVIIVSLYRLKTINPSTLSQNPPADFVNLAIWSGLELHVGIICACLPDIHSLLKSLNTRLGSVFTSEEKTLPSAASDSRDSHERNWSLPRAKTSSEPLPEAIKTVQDQNTVYSGFMSYGIRAREI